MQMLASNYGRQDSKPMILKLRFNDSTAAESVVFASID